MEDRAKIIADALAKKQAREAAESARQDAALQKQLDDAEILRKFRDEVLLPGLRQAERELEETDPNRAVKIIMAHHGPIRFEVFDSTKQRQLGMEVMLAFSMGRRENTRGLQLWAENQRGNFQGEFCNPIHEFTAKTITDKVVKHWAVLLNPSFM